MNLVDKLKIIQNYLFAGNYQKVLENSQIILKKIPNNSFLLNLIGMAYQGLFQYQKSVLFFRDAIRNEKNNKAAMNNLANSLKAIGEYEESEQLYEKILKLDPEYINAYNNFANLKISFNDYEGAILLMEKAINICKEKNKNSLDQMFSFFRHFPTKSKIINDYFISQIIFSMSYFPI